MNPASSSTSNVLVSFSSDAFKKKPEFKVPRFLQHAYTVDRQSPFQRWAECNSLPSISKFSSMRKLIESDDSVALASDWQVSMADVLASIAQVIDKQDKEFKDKFYRQVAQILLEKRNRFGE